MSRLRPYLASPALLASLLLAVLFLEGHARAAAPDRTTPPLSRDRRIAAAPSIIDNDDRMDVNNLDMAVSNHGSFAYDLITGNAGLVYPRGSANTVVFAGGLWMGARIPANGQLRLAVASYSQEYGPGPMRNGTFVPDEVRFRNYRIDRGDTTSVDYREWPVGDGAPLDALGHPLLLGDATIWSVYNDADAFLHNEAGTGALGVEVQQTTFAFNRAGPLGQTMFLKFKLTNKGTNLLEDAHVGLWLDTDLGGFNDDLAASDPARSLGYTYNATNEDAQYGDNPPAVGIDLLRGPVVTRSPGVTDTLGMTSFITYINGQDPGGPTQHYAYLRGLHLDDSPIHEFGDSSLPTTTFMVSGDPVMGTGWLDSSPADKRLLLGAGPFRMAPGESQEIVAAIIVGQGSDRLASVSDLRAKDNLIQQFYRENLGPPPASPVTAPPLVFGEEGTPIAFSVQAALPDGAPLTLFASSLPVGASFLDHGNGIGDFAWTPDLMQAGEYEIDFTARSGSTLVGFARTRIEVSNHNRPPLADAGGPYSGGVGIPIQLDGSGSSDPDGDPLVHIWFFGDGSEGSGARPSHAYAAAGSYVVELYVRDNDFFNYSFASTMATVYSVLPARVFADRGNKTIRLRSGRPTWCVRLESEDGAFQAADIDPASFVLLSSGTGVVDQIASVASKTVIGSDSDGNGVAEACPCFATADLARLFSGVNGRTVVPIDVEAALMSGPRVRGSMDVTVMGSSGAVSAYVVPGGPEGKSRLEVFTRNPGAIRVRVFDVRGRLLATLAETPWASPGLHAYSLDAVRGARGIAFYRVETPAGRTSGRFALSR